MDLEAGGGGGGWRCQDVPKNISAYPCDQSRCANCSRRRRCNGSGVPSATCEAETERGGWCRIALTVVVSYFNIIIF